MRYWFQPAKTSVLSQTNTFNSFPLNTRTNTEGEKDRFRVREILSTVAHRKINRICSRAVDKRQRNKFHAQVLQINTHTLTVWLPIFACSFWTKTKANKWQWQKRPKLLLIKIRFFLYIRYRFGATVFFFRLAASCNWFNTTNQMNFGSICLQIWNSENRKCICYNEIWLLSFVDGQTFRFLLRIIKEMEI